jgi:outer membrane protein assembly factor BamE (lipoprotein component of BamABCDE complex)
LQRTGLGCDEIGGGARPLNAVFCGLEEEQGVRPTMLKAWGAIIAGVALVAGATGCAALHPHITLGGRPFPIDRVTEVREGLSADEVTAILGEPFDERQSGGERIWQYFERYHPRGCTTEVFGILLSGRPTLERDVEITFLNGRVARVHMTEPRSSDVGKRAKPQNNQMQRTGAAQAKDARR